LQDLTPLSLLNELRSDRFDVLESSGLLERAEALGARQIRLRKLPDALLQRVAAGNASFWAALQPGTLGLLDRQRLKVWLLNTPAGFKELV
jgi:hypothetical protein